MDQIGFAGRGIRNARGADLPRALTLPSRAAALDALRAGLDAQAGPVLLTGEAGVGKSWVCERLREGPGRRWLWAAVDLTPAVEPEGFYRLLLRALAVEAGAASDVVTGRAAVEDALPEENAAGSRRVMIVDEAQNGSAECLEEVRILSNALGTPSGFAGVLLVAQHGLNRRLAYRTLGPLETRVAARVCLRSLEFDEFLSFAAALNPELVRDTGTLERLHRAVGGNPSLARRAAAAFGPSPRESSRTEASSIPGPPPVALAVTLPAELLPARPSRPPIRVEDGMVEVGWLEPTADSAADDQAEAAETADSRPSSERPDLVDAADPSPGAAADLEERIHDPYAAIQAWGEWNLAGGEDAADVEEGAAESGQEGGPSESSDSSSVWAEGQHVFAPYSQLFSRLRPSREPT